MLRSRSYRPSATWMWKGRPKSMASEAPCRFMSGLAPWIECGAGWTNTMGSPRKISQRPRKLRAPSRVVAGPSQHGLERMPVAVHRPGEDGHVSPVLAFVFEVRLDQLRRLARGQDPSALHDEGVPLAPAALGEHKIGGDQRHGTPFYHR